MSRAATSRLKMNPQLGSPPTLEWRHLPELGIDDAYQRSILTGPSQSLIRKIAMFWDWGLCQPLAVSRRPDGSFTIVDGQHRAAAAKLRGDIPHLPCVITPYSNAGDEAAAFVALNQMRRPLSALDLFKAAVAAEDTEALSILRAINGAGLRLATSTNLICQKPGAVSNIGAIQRYFRRLGERPVRGALLTLAKAYSGEIQQYAGTLFPGLATVISDELRLGSSPVEILDQLVPIVSANSQDKWRRLIKAAVSESGGMARESSELVFRRVWRARHNVSGVASESVATIGVKETAWCVQCDQRVGGTKAANCTDRFCSLRKAKAA